MRFKALALDHDGTIAQHGELHHDVRSAIEEARVQGIAVIAATILKQHGFKQVENALVSMAACAAVGCPIVKGDE